MAAIDVVIMAAGKGTRMKSRLPKVLHRLAGRALLQHVLECVWQLPVRRVVVITGNGAEQVEQAVASWPRGANSPAPQFVRQEPQLGTGHAVQQALPVLPDDDENTLAARVLGLLTAWAARLLERLRARP